MLSPPNILRKIKSRRMSWARHVAHMKDKSINVFIEKILAVDGKMIVK
jgi:hypothetical protein